MSTSAKIGILLVNLGTPSAPTPIAVKRYLSEFLSDPRVVQIPRLLWWPILHGIVLRVRPKRSAALYQKIWTQDGSPLLIHSQQLRQALQENLNKVFNVNHDDDSQHQVSVALGMRYGEPSIAQALATLQRNKPQHLIILPLYPQYSISTTASTFDAINKVLKNWRHIPEIQFISQYHQEASFLTAWTEHIKKHWLQSSEDNHLLFSFHGLPQRMVDAGDPYQQQCHTTAQAIAESLQLKPEQWGIVFQSRFGRAKWLTPYCDKTLQSMPQQGKKNVTVVCPGFAVDCLETLEEIAMQNRKIFLEAGGENFTYIPALNATEPHVKMLSKIILNRVVIPEVY